MRGLLGETRRESEWAPLARWVAAHERGLIAAYLVAVATLFAVLGIWGVFARGAERAIDAWNARTGQELLRAEGLVRDAKHAEAVECLEALDRDHPAVFVKHGLDREREKVLELLGKCYVALDKKGKAIATLERAVAFDPRNWRNHHALAEALLAFSESDRAELELRAVLAIHPNHLPTVEALTGMLFDVATLYGKVVELHRQYIDALSIASIELAIDGQLLALDVPVDGKPHVLEVPLELASNWSGTLRLATHGYSARIGELSLVPALRVGVSAHPEALSIAPEGWTPNSASSTSSGAFASAAQDSSFELSISAPGGAASLRLELTLYKAMNASLWTKLETSYRNKLLFDELERVRARTVIGGCLEAGSLVD